MKSSFYSEAELKKLGLKAFGKNVLISRKCSLYGADKMTLGHDVRIDDFCILSGHITIGNYVHIAAYSALYAGHAGIEIQDFCGVSSRCVLYAITDDYSGNSMTNPMVPDRYRKIQAGKIIFKRHALVGTGSTILPGVVLEEGTAVGAMSLILKSTLPWKMYFGIPARVLMERDKVPLRMEQEFLGGLNG